MLEKYVLACLLCTLVKNAVTEISLDYYFGFEDTLRTAKYMENCNNNGMQESCQQRCGPNHACLLGKCFCVEMKPQLKEDAPEEASAKQVDAGSSSLKHDVHREDDKEGPDTEVITAADLVPLSNAVLEELIRRSKSSEEDLNSSSNEESSSSESESEEFDNYD